MSNTLVRVSHVGGLVGDGIDVKVGPRKVIVATRCECGMNTTEMCDDCGVTVCGKCGTHTGGFVFCTDCNPFITVSA
jgi:hypothetical protein